MEKYSTLSLLILPLFTFVFLGLLGNKIKPKVSGLIGSCMLGVTTLFAYYIAYSYFIGGTISQGIQFDFVWLPFTDTLTFNMGVLLDPISVMMLVVITTVSLMVHIYSMGYMKGEKGFQRYYAFLSLLDRKSTRLNSSH